MTKAISYCILIICILFGKNLLAGDYYTNYRPPMRTKIKLSGSWKFSIGDLPDWGKVGYDDTDWEDIKVPSNWEEQGFHGYNGYAWYRKTFKVGNDLGDKALMLVLGYIDDADEVYLNGELIASSGAFPPHFKTAYEQERLYPLRHDMLRKNEENVIAVRIYDGHFEGGIIRGDVGIFSILNQKEPDLNLTGRWMFRTGDLNYIPVTDNFYGEPINVPGHWEKQLAPGYDGYAWYQKSFCLPTDLQGKKLVLVIGKIDDTDMVFLNGKQIGSTGLTWDGQIEHDDHHSWEKVRTYFIPMDVLETDGNNILNVRVHDWTGDGGIYQGPVGLVRQEKLISFLRKN
ncbi:MAG: beta galactosidase jelly roll domain-containing protein [Bacteroidia bacterium]